MQEPDIVRYKSTWGETRSHDPMTNLNLCKNYLKNLDPTTRPATLTYLAPHVTLDNKMTWYQLLK